LELVACLFRDTADIGQASPSLGVGICAIASPLSFFGHDFFHDRGPPVLVYIFPDVFGSVAEAVTNELIHVPISSFSIREPGSSLLATMQAPFEPR